MIRRGKGRFKDWQDAVIERVKKIADAFGKKRDLCKSDRDDLFQTGMLAALEEWPNWKPPRCRDFSAFAALAASAAITLKLGDEATIARVPDATRRDWQSKSKSKAEARRKSNGRQAFALLIPVDVKGDLPDVIEERDVRTPAIAARAEALATEHVGVALLLAVEGGSTVLGAAKAHGISGAGVIGGSRAVAARLISEARAMLARDPELRALAGLEAAGSGDEDPTAPSAVPEAAPHSAPEPPTESGSPDCESPERRREDLQGAPLDVQDACLAIESTPTVPLCPSVVPVFRRRETRRIVYALRPVPFESAAGHKRRRSHPANQRRHGAVGRWRPPAHLLWVAPSIPGVHLGVRSREQRTGPPSARAAPS